MLIFVFYVLNWSANSKVPRDPGTMVCCLYVGICFGVVPHHMPDHVVTLACHMRPHKIRSQTHELTCEACHVHNRRGFGANDGIYYWALTFGLYHPCILLSGLKHAWSIWIFAVCIFEHIIDFWA